jgi:Zn-finger nucleic acid-binding protein
MNCRNCAAPMELFDRRRYYFCRHCGTFEFLERGEADGIHVLERRADALPCPLCRAPLAKSLLDGHHVVEYCEQCRGVLLQLTAFTGAVMGRRSRATGPGSPVVELDRKELERRVTCPSCSRMMEVHPYYGPGNVIIDTCGKCDLVWLDFGELKQIGDAPGQDRGRIPASIVADTVAVAAATGRVSPIDPVGDPVTAGRGASFVLGMLAGILTD